MSDPIEGKVAAILSESLVVISVGAEAGVREGMIFAVLAQGAEVKDPDSGEVLGRWEVPKGHIRATHVQLKISTCEAFEPTAREEPGDRSTQTLSASMIAVSMRRHLAEGTAAKLNVRRGDVEGMPEIGPVQVGDRVRSLPEG